MPKANTRLDIVHSTLFRFKSIKGQPPWNKYLIILSLAKGPLPYGSLAKLVTGGTPLGGPLETARREGLVDWHSGTKTYFLTPKGEQEAARLLNPPPVPWP